MMKHRPLALLAFAPAWASLVIGGDVVRAAESERSMDACFEIVVPERHMQLTSPLLIDKCNGKTWLLTRRYVRTKQGPAQVTYRWVALEVEGGTSPAATPPPAKTSAAKAPSPVAKAKPPQQRCFEFDGRRFCE